MKTVVVSGGFDPLHIGHVRLLQEARSLGDELLVIVNNDDWLMKFKNKTPFMPEQERVEILLALECVDEVYLSMHDEDSTDRSVAEDLSILRPDVFANGGDRDPNIDDVPTPEYEVCKELGIEMVWGVGGGKVQSSSWLVNK